METMPELVQLVLEDVQLEEDGVQQVVGTMPVARHMARLINIPIVGLGMLFVLSYV